MLKQTLRIRNLKSLDPSERDSLTDDFSSWHTDIQAAEKKRQVH